MMYYFLTVFVFLISSFWMSCTYRKAHVGYATFDDITPTKPVPKRSKRSVKPDKKPTEKKGSDSSVQKVIDVSEQKVDDPINVVDVIVPVVPEVVVHEEVVPEVVEQPVIAPLPPPPPVDSRTILGTELNNANTVSSLKKLETNLLSPEAFQAISQVMEVDGYYASNLRDKYKNDDRFVVDFYNPKILPRNDKFIIYGGGGRTYGQNRKFGAFYNDELSLGEIKAFGNLYTSDIFPNSSDIDDDEVGYTYSNAGGMSAYTYIYQNYREDPSSKEMPMINLTLYGVKDNTQEEVSIAGSGTLLISESQNQDTIHFSFGTMGKSVLDYKDRVVLDKDGKPQSGKLTVSYSNSQSIPGNNSKVFDLANLSHEEKRALKEFRIFNIQ